LIVRSASSLAAMYRAYSSNAGFASAPQMSLASRSISADGAGRRLTTADSPCLSALRLAIFLPAAERGPQLLQLLRLFAACLQTEVN
jgi:hypothetical protein